MRTLTSRALVMTVSAAVLLSAAIGGAEAAAAPVKGTSTALRALVRQTNALPRAAASQTQRARLRRAARRARRVARGRPCSAVASLATYRRTLRAIKPKSGRRFRRVNARLADLGPSSLETSFLLLRDSRTSRCGGGVKRSNVKSATARVLESDKNVMRVRVRLPDVRFVGRTAGGRAWTQLVLPNTDAPGRPGTPGIPVASSPFAIPDGATVSVDADTGDSYTVEGVDVFPVQPEPVDQNRPAPRFDRPPFVERPFTLSEPAYQRKGFVPAEPGDADALGKARDLTIGALQVPAAQYDAAAKKLKVLTSVDVTVAFNGGPKTFSGQLGSPWEQPARRLAASLLNAGIVIPVGDLVVRPCGEEMLVITNPATIDAANSFAGLKRSQGMRTSVFQTGSALVGSTAAEIQAFIRSRLTAAGCIHPSYVTIFGDDDLVPTHPGINSIPSDLPYSMRDNADELPDVAVGRIIGNDQAAVQNAVNKISTYETTPPTGPMLSRATMAAQFQDDNLDGTENRTFIQFAETVRTGLVSRGVAVDRIYDDSPTATPLKFNDGTDLPAALKKPAFAWDGDGADVTAAWNEGRFMVVHRDHGWSDGWGHPGFTTTDVQALTNGANLPVVLSINCSSGAYDYDETSFVGEALVKPSGGAVGAFGDTRDSPSWHNTQIALGFVDGMLPTVLPSEGPATKQRVGNALIHGKLRLASLAPPSSDGNTRNELYLWHYFGDPSMQMWGGGFGPLKVDPSLFAAVFEQLHIAPPPGDPPPYRVNVTLPPEFNGQAFSLLKNGEVVGKGTALNGAAQIPATFGDGSLKPGELQVALDAEGSPPITIPVQGVPQPQAPPPPPPPAEKQKTTLTLDQPSNVGWRQFGSFSGKLAPGFAGATIRLRFTSAKTQTVVDETTTTDANGNYTLRKFFDNGNGDTWQVQAFFDGDATHEASQSPAREFQQFPS